MTGKYVALVTVGNPARVTGGYLFHQRLADRAPQHGTRIDFVSIPDVPLPWALLTGPMWLRHPALRCANALVVDSIAAAAAAPWLGRISLPTLAMLHQMPGGMDHGHVARSIRAPFDRWTYRQAELLMVASEWLAEELARAGITRDRLLVVPPGKDPTTATELEKAPAPVPVDLRQGRRSAAVCVANWLPRKGILELLDAVAMLPNELVTLHLVGDTRTRGRYAGRVRRRLAASDLRDRVKVHGLIAADAVSRMYQRADMFVLPSFEEPYGTVWGEAMAAGIPVIGWRAGNLPFLADDGREGLLVPVGDVASLSRAIGRVALERELQRDLGQAARERAAVRPTWDDTADLFFTAVSRVLHRRAGGRRPGAGR